ncbi:MAG: hypothetical protein DI544_09630 [Sphingomonas taxi]|uniref:DUF6456 domain-containing protein n=1 Tax=Sphingomonas taxi TaxID=1549858 RepID=A0A2W5P6A6_9SPHN|nr:MAG: hypothetical protein DI544_09630 [Sphingomonas taxi]
MRDLVEQEIDGAGRRGALVARARTGRTITVNRRESPLAWLTARGLVTARQSEAGERLSADHERAALGVSVTMRWEARVDGGAGARLDPGEAQVAAKRRFDGAMAAAGPGLRDVLWRVVCAGESLPDSERALGWPTRSGRLVLMLALDRVADHYRLP